ncbi:hypothetical protein DICVIV_00251 [Dictyocaulus viviparus]|uniref:Uncharacterized protein n=1 Tax=Dictyocaulus viviparus TaxID=29172 RepID=A0A0D8Y9I6_DICVI|nr:hypothetical protein DICVIV_00251 [Dictyocaulus viviparus]
MQPSTRGSIARTLSCHLQSPLAERNQLVRLNTDNRQKTLDRPPLMKAQSLITTQNEQCNGGSSRDESPRDSPQASRTRDGNGLSPSISNHSLEKLNFSGDESVTSLTFIHSFSRRNDLRTAPCLWIGTSAGASIALNLILPQDRLSSTIVVAPSDILSVIS